MVISSGPALRVSSGGSDTEGTVQPNVEFNRLSFWKPMETPRVGFSTAADQ
jgi:hypothetical protein